MPDEGDREEDGVTRRRFVQACVGVATAAAVGSTLASIVGLRPEYDVAPPPPTAQSVAVCPVCSVGCGLLSIASRGEPFPSRGDPKSSHTTGMLCDRGAFLPASDWPSTIRKPLRRISSTTKGTAASSEHFEEVEWEEAIDALTATLVETGLVFGQSARGCILGSNAPMEDAYVAAKLFKGVMGSGSIDSVESLHSRAGERAYMEQLGEPGPPVSFDDVGLASLIVVVGEDIAITHPVLYAHVAEAVLTRGAQLLVIDPRLTATATRTRAMHVPVRAGGEVALLNAMGSVLVHELEVAPAAAARDHSLNVDAFAEFLKLYAPRYDENERVDAGHIVDLCDGPSDWVAQLGNRDGQGYPKSFDVLAITGIPEDDIRELAKLWNRAGNVITIWGSRLAGTGDGGAGASTIINLHLLTDQIGRPGAGPLGLQATAGGRGAIDVGATPMVLPGGVPAGTGEATPGLQAAWGDTFAAAAANLPPGKGVVEILGRASRRQLPVLLLLGGSVSEEVPDSHLVDTALRSAYVVSNAAHLEDPDVAYTDLLLPGGTWYDREGHYISSERRVALSWPVFPLETRGWRTIYVLSKIGGAMGPPELFDENESSWSWMRELAEVTRGTPADLTHLPLLFDLREARGVQWPVATERSASFGGTARRHMGQDGRGPGFPTESGKAVVLPREHPGLRRATDPAYPLRAVMGLDIGTWWDGTFFELTGGEVERSRVRRGAYVEMTREDAQDLGLAEMALALVTSLSGEVELPVRYAQKGTVRGHVFIPWGGDKRTQVLAPSFPLDRNGVPPWSVFHVRVEVAPPAGEE